MVQRVYDLEERLVRFSVSMIKLIENMPRTFLGNVLANQLSKSGTSPALNYGEAQSAESQADFIHKMKIALKELRETNVNLQIINKLEWFGNNKLVIEIKECNELIAIFMKSIQTAQSNKQAR